MAQFGAVPPRDDATALEIIAILTGYELPVVTDNIAAIDAADPSIVLGSGLTGDNGAGFHIAGLYSNPPPSGQLCLVFHDVSTGLYHIVVTPANEKIIIDFAESSIQAGQIAGYEDNTGPMDPYPGNVNILLPGFSSFEDLQAALPVTFSSFNGQVKTGAVFLDWTTDSESENEYFSVERSTTAGEFEEVGRVAGAGTTNEVQAYEFIDPSPASGENYYRLRQVDFGGAYSFSSVLLLDVSNDGEALLNVFPNPAKDNIVVSLSGESAKESSLISLTDAQGRLVMQWQQTTGTSNTVDVSAIPTGLYQLIIRDDQKVESRKLIINRN